MPEPPREWMGGGPQSSMPMRCAAHSEQFEMAMRALHSWQRSSNGAPKQPPAVMPHNHPVPRQGPLSQQNQQQQQQAQEQRDEGQGTYPPHSFPQRQPQLEGQQQQQQQQPPQGQKQQRKQSAESDGSDTQVQGASAATPTLTTASANTNAPERAGGSGRDDGSSQRRQHHAHTQGVTRNDGSPIKQQQQQQRRQSLPSASAAGPQECPAALPPTEPSLRPPLTHGTQGDVSGADGTPEVHMDGNPSGNPAAHTDGNPSGNQAPVQGLSRGFLPARRPGPPRPSQVSQPAVNGATVAETNDAGPV
uniref:Uncharacterized protein n=1 Tax=Dunaliella tertiolecta TaxID=3047 RepID=A0A7S3VQU9_DUNTE